MEVKNLKETGESGDSGQRIKLLPFMSSIIPDLEFRRKRQAAETAKDKVKQMSE